MRTSLQIFFCGISTLVLCTQTESLGQSQPSTSKARESEFVIQGMTNERERLKSGICTMEYVETLKDPDFSQRKPVTLHFAFAEDDRCRIDCTLPNAPGALRKKSEKNKDKNSSAPEASRGYLIHTKDRNIGWVQGDATIQINSPEDRWPDWIPYFDVKAFGTNSWLEVQRGWTWTWDRRLKEWLDPAGQPNSTTLENGICTMTWQLGSEDHEWVLEVNTEKGFTPFHGVMRNRGKSKSPKNKKPPWNIMQEIKTTWEQKSSVWVPVHFELHMEQIPSEPGQATRDLTMTISWEKINSEIPPELFSYQSFGAPNDVAVMDNSLGTTIMVKPYGTGLQTEASGEPRLKRNVLMRIILFGGILLAIVIYYATYRLRQRSRTKPPDAGLTAQGDHGAAQ